MSPSAALHSSIFLSYLAIVGGLLVAALVAIVTLNLTTHRDLTHTWQSFRGWLIMIPLVLLGVFIGREATIMAFTLLAIAGFKEYARATGLYTDWPMTVAAYLAIFACGLFAVLSDPATGELGWYGMYMTLPVYAITTFLFLPIARNRTKGQLQTLALTIMGFMYIGWMFGFLAFLANSDNAYGYLLFLIFAVEVNDIAAYTFGKLLGRRKLRSEISPNKTWAGSLGAVGVSLLMPWLLHFSFPHFTAWQLLLTGLIVGIGGQLGDLSISIIKRDLGVKDMGAVLQGHGGVLDRIDSLIFVAPLFFHMTRWYHGI